MQYFNVFKSIEEIRAEQAAAREEKRIAAIEQEQLRLGGTLFEMLNAAAGENTLDRGVYSTTTRESPQHLIHSDTGKIKAWQKPDNKCPYMVFVEILEPSGIARPILSARINLKSPDPDKVLHLHYGCYGESRWFSEDGFDDFCGLAVKEVRDYGKDRASLEE